jgi:hypothetical protein
MDAFAQGLQLEKLKSCSRPAELPTALIAMSSLEASHHAKILLVPGVFNISSPQGGYVVFSIASAVAPAPAQDPVGDEKLPG